jgi:O-antigen/teichoic acid export membrane protein
MLSYLGLVFFFVQAGPYLYEHQLLGATYWFSPSLGIGYVFIANLLANIITMLMLLPPYLGLFKRKAGEPFFDQVLWKKMMLYAGPLIIVGLAGVINEVLDRSLLKTLLPGDLDSRLAQVGIYGACYKIAIFMNLLTQAFNYAAEPFFFKHAAKDGSRQLYADVALLFSIIGSLVFLGVMVFMDIFQYFVAAPYREGIHIVPILLIANLFLGLYYSLATWYKLADKTGIGAYISIFGAFITIVGNLLLIPWLGYMGAAWATLACYASMLIACYLLGQRYYPVPYPVLKILAYMAAALVAYFLYQWLRNQFAEASFLSFALAALIWLLYLAGVWLFEGKNLIKIVRR